ncbi:hypothetical protein C8R45DRAFT_1186917 [Mycena sanguinolenta]|nr:hypothetical protein C8R45DRAFT_1186917 [Mycena sanguinolenta]
MSRELFARTSEGQIWRVRRIHVRVTSLLHVLSDSQGHVGKLVECDALAIVLLAHSTTTTTPSPHLSHILATNHPPLESQTNVLRNFVSVGRARLVALDAKITLLQSAMDQLLKDKDELEDQISNHERGFSLIRRMPTEILSHIFVHTLRPQQPTPWIISWVCALWRTIIISQPCFWTTIRHDDEIFHHGYSGNEVELMWETQLRRSGNRPLNVEFFADKWQGLLPSEERLLQVICKHAGRWETVSFRGPEELYGHLHGFIQDQLANLHKLTIEIPLEDEDAPLDMFHDAPQLRTVSVNRDSWNHPIALMLPWSRIQEYGRSNTWDGHLRALHSASNLVNCTLEIERSSLTQTATFILLPRLLRLSVSNASFLSNLETPALEELYCGYWVDLVQSFLHRQTCKLQKLVIWTRPPPANSTYLTRVVEAVPTATNLALLFPLPAVPISCTTFVLAPRWQLPLKGFPSYFHWTTLVRITTGILRKQWSRCGKMGG